MERAIQRVLVACFRKPGYILTYRIPRYRHLTCTRKLILSQLKALGSKQHKIRVSLSKRCGDVFIRAENECYPADSRPLRTLNLSRLQASLQDFTPSSLTCSLTSRVHLSFQYALVVLGPKRRFKRWRVWRPELISQILLSERHSLSQLANLSKVCRLWYRIVFPVLYHTVYLSWDAPLFAARLLDEDLPLEHLQRSELEVDIPHPIEGLRAADHVQALILDNRMQREVPVLQPLEEYILHVGFLLLKKLKRIDWNLPFYPKDMKFFDYLSFRCPEIEYVSFEICDRSPFRMISDTDLTSLFSFSELKHIRIKDTRLPYDDETNGRVSSSLVKMILRSPNLQYLELDLKESPRHQQFMSTGWLVEAISPVLQHTFVHLKVFRLGGTASIDSEFLLLPEEENLIRDFILRHPGLHTLQLPWDWEMNSLIRQPIQETWTILQDALPNLRCFEGPTYLVMLFLKINVGQRLERLVVLDSAEDEDSDLAGFAGNFPRLPNLRALEFWSTYMLDTTGFSEVVKGTPNITELTITWVDGDPEVTIKCLISLKYLRVLTLGFNVLPHLANRAYKTVAREQEAEEVLQLAQKCTSLEVIRILPEENIDDTFDYNAQWHISRSSNESINVSFSSLRKLPRVKKGVMVDVDMCRRKYSHLLNSTSTTA
ncbi:hypothetical protein OPQ81_011547 [Rhizoctonia solani]|nr:hypothetical protein OPQ81_011547 [Rhizoctonia solani]